jgi:hypothetical protein
VNRHIYSIDAYPTQFVSACRPGNPEILASSVGGYKQGDLLLIREVAHHPPLATGRTVCREVIAIRTYPHSSIGNVKLGGKVIREQKESA